MSNSKSLYKKLIVSKNILNLTKSITDKEKCDLLLSAPLDQYYTNIFIKEKIISLSQSESNTYNAGVGLNSIWLTTKIAEAVALINSSRKEPTIINKIDNINITYNKGISEALSIFKHIQSTNDHQAIILAEYIYLVHELKYCDEKDCGSISRLTHSIERFNELYRSLKNIEKYIISMKEDNFSSENSINIYLSLADFFSYLLCLLHKASLRYMIGIDYIESSLYKQRYENIEKAYIYFHEKIEELEYHYSSTDLLITEEEYMDEIISQDEMYSKSNSSNSLFKIKIGKEDFNYIHTKHSNQFISEIFN